MREAEQLMLPVEIRPIEMVSWFNVVKTEKKRRLFGKKLRTELMIDPETSFPSLTTIKVDDINQLNDPDLRYALRLSAAASAAGWEEHSPGSMSMHDVWIHATDEGADSQLTGATYSGVVTAAGDTFMRNFERFAPQPEVPGMVFVFVPDKNSGPSDRYWVQQTEH